MSDIFTYMFFAQAVGIIASALIILSAHQKVDNNLKAFLIIGNIIFAVHFFMLAGYAGMLVNLLNAVRVGCSIKFHKSTKMMLCFMATYVLFAIVVYEEIWDVLPFVSALLGTYSLFKLSGIKMRVIGMMGACAWLSYGIIFHSIGGIITETTALILYATTITHLSKDEKKQQNDQKTSS